MQVTSLLEKQDRKSFWLNRMTIVSTTGNQDTCSAFKTINSFTCSYGRKYFVWHDFHTVPGLYSCYNIILKHPFMITTGLISCDPPFFAVYFLMALPFEKLWPSWVFHLPPANFCQIPKDSCWEGAWSQSNTVSSFIKNVAYNVANHCVRECKMLPCLKWFVNIRSILPVACVMLPQQQYCYLRLHPCKFTCKHLMLFLFHLDICLQKFFLLFKCAIHWNKMIMFWQPIRL